MKSSLVLLALAAGAIATSADAKPTTEVQPAPEMQRLLNAFVGTWTITEKYEASAEMPNGGTGEGEEVYRSGPGGLSMIEDYHSRTPSGEISGLGMAWWDTQAQGFRALWCYNANPRGCTVLAKLARWEGKEFVVGDEWEVNGNKMQFKEVLSDISQASFTQTLYQGEGGGELKRVETISAKRVPTQGSQH